MGPVAGRQALLGRRIGIDADVAGAAGSSTGSPLRRDYVLGRADGKPCLGKIEVFAANPEPAAKLAGTARVTDQFEPQHTGWELALDYLD